MIKNFKLPQGSGLFLLLLLLIIFFSIGSPFFFSTGNFFNILANTAVLGLIAIAMTYVIISGGIDLSVGSIAALTGVIVTTLFGKGVPLWIAIGAGVLVGIICGYINGAMITYLKINPLITTLGMMSIARGLAFVLSRGLTNTILDPTFGLLGRGFVPIIGLQVPVPIVILIILFVAGHFALKYSIFGRNMYAIGGNPEASRLAGIRTNKNQVVVYVLSGLASAIAGLILTSQLAAGAPQAAQMMELSVIAAVILGGSSLAGGKGNIYGTFLGVMILAIVSNGLTIMNVSSYWKDVARGAILLIAVGFDQFRFMGASEMFRKMGLIKQPTPCLNSIKDRV